jgi:hypothetical protein
LLIPLDYLRFLEINPRSDPASALIPVTARKHAINERVNALDRSITYPFAATLPRRRLMMDQIQETKTQAEQLAKEFNSAVKKRHKRERAQREDKQYLAMVAEAKRIDQTADKGQMRLAQIAAQVETKYGEETLKQFAKDTGIALCTLQRRRSVWRAWEKEAASPKCYSVAEALQAHPERGRIIQEQPDITTREARKLMREWKAQQQPQKANDDGFGWTVKGTQRWFNDLVQRASKAIEDGPALDKVKEEIIKQAIEPTLLDTVQKGAEVWIKLVNQLRPLFEAS